MQREGRSYPKGALSWGTAMLFKTVNQQNTNYLQFIFFFYRVGLLIDPLIIRNWEDLLDNLFSFLVPTNLFPIVSSVMTYSAVY